MQQYGLIVADNGSNMYFQGTPDARWNDGDLHNLGNVDASAFEVVQMGTKYDAATAPTGAAPTISSFAASQTSRGRGNGRDPDLDRQRRLLRLYRRRRAGAWRKPDGDSDQDNHLHPELNQPIWAFDKSGYGYCQIGSRLNSGSLRDWSCREPHFDAACDESLFSWCGGMGAHPRGAFLMLDSWHEKNPCRCASASGTRVSGGFCEALQISAQGHETPDDASSASPRLEFRRTRSNSSHSPSHQGAAVRLLIPSEIKESECGREGVIHARQGLCLL